MAKISVGVFGATGMVGQTIVQLLDNHPWFEVTELAASENSAGKSYEDVMRMRWSAGSEIPEYARGMIVKEAGTTPDCNLVLSALDSKVAGPIEEGLAKAGYAVSSNSRNHRMFDDVPLLIPEINANHINLIKKQQKERGWEGFIVTDPNCSAMQLCIALKPLQDAFGLESVMITTMQALSGAGYPGVPSMDIMDNVIPFIGDEEEKLQSEPLKILGSFAKDRIRPANFKISAQCNRVAVRHGHMETVNVKLSRKADEDKIIKAFESFKPLKEMGLPSAPERPIVYMRNENRPQPKLDANIENGMASVVGRLRKCSILDYKFIVLGHNLVRGAAGAAILNAELLKAKGYVG
ncbi:MAG: aspartate-semialdehyde dehydrogenase [Candidatus Micrarchaeota archaeon]|nr:aspartate-semialdehyde dehydrogenase [Candidatus Micrarchaeota archaeon]